MPAFARLYTIAALIIIAAPLLTSGALAKHHPKPKSSSACHHGPARQLGKAVFYGQNFDGRIMANGKAFDANAMTGASRTLPLGTRARVTNLRTHKSANIIITDRGQLRAPHLILDLSAGAARAIGLTDHEGVAPVSIVTTGCS